MNQILDHDIYKNNSATGQSRFHVRNPHVVGAVLMHLEELLDIGKKGDSVAGLPRFLIGHFLSVCSKVCPENLSAQEMQNLLLEDPNYFNDLSFDEIVKAATNLLLLADAAFPYQHRRDDEVGPAASRYSEIRGIHTMEFAEGVVIAVFNKTSMRWWMITVRPRKQAMPRQHFSAKTRPGPFSSSQASTSLSKACSTSCPWQASPLINGRTFPQKTWCGKWPR